MVSFTYYYFSDSSTESPVLKFAWFVECVSVNMVFDLFFSYGDKRREKLVVKL